MQIILQAGVARGFSGGVKARIGVGGGAQLPPGQEFRKVPPLPDVTGGVQGGAVLVQELVVPALRETP
jgi:hypothetical protein